MSPDRLLGEDQIRLTPADSMIPRCPCCGVEVELARIDLGDSFRCPRCDQWLCVRRVYPLTLGWGALAVSLAVSLLFGFRGYLLFWLSLLGWAPALILVILLSMLFFPPRLKVSKNDSGTRTFTSLVP